MRYLIVGYGNIGTKRRAALGARCVATVDPVNPAADFRKPEECPPNQYDAVILAVPNDVKLSLLETFLCLGKHVLVEKPLLFTEPDEGERLARCARKHGAIWYTAYNLRFEPSVVGLKAELDAGTIGTLYHARMFYGNGTAGRIAGSWRDSALGVLEDLATHLIDLTGFLFGRVGADFVVWDRRAHELRGVDHVVLATRDRAIVLEASFLSWRNCWVIEIVGSRGALQMHGLTKWGSSELIIQRRRLPCGVPDETRRVVEGPDRTWHEDLAHFEAAVREGQSSCGNDVWLSSTVLAAARAPLD